MNNQHYIQFFRSMGMMLHAGITSAEAIELYDDPKLKSMKDDLELGLPLSTCMKETQLFNDYVIDMISVGERCGTLDLVFTNLADYYQQQVDLKQNIRHAITYPLAMIVMLLFIVFILLTQVVPIFADVFNQLGSSLDGIALVLLHIGLGISKYAWLFLILVVVFIACYFYFIQKDHLPLPKNFQYQLSKQQFIALLAMGLKSGLESSEAISQAKKVVTLQTLQSQIEDLDPFLPLNKSLYNAKLVSGMDARMMDIGEKTGHLDQVLTDYAIKLDQNNKANLERIVGMIEPTLVAILCLFVGAILLSLMIPLMSMMSSL